MEQLEQNIKQHLVLNQDKVLMQDYLNLFKTVQKKKTEKRNSLIEGNKPQFTVATNLRFQEQISDYENQIKVLKQKVETYKEKYIKNKQGFDQESKKFIELDIKFQNKLKELKEVTQQRNRMENEILQMKLNLQKQIEQFDEQIMQYKKFNQEQKKQVTQIKFQKNLLRKQIYRMQSQNYFQETQQKPQEQGDFQIIDDLDFHYVKLSQKDNIHPISELQNYNSEHFIQNINPKNSFIVAYCGNSFTQISIQQEKFEIHKRYTLKYPVLASCYDENGEYLLQSNQQAQLTLFDPKKLANKFTINLKSPANFVQFVSKNNFITIDCENNLQLWDLNKQTIKQQKSFDIFSQITALTSDQNNNIFIGFANGTYSIIDQKDFTLKDNFEIWHDGSVGQIQKIDENTVSSICLNKQIYYTDIRKNGVQNLIDLSFTNFSTKKFQFQAGNYKQIIGTDQGDIISFDITKNYSIDQKFKVSDYPVPYLYYNEPLDQIYAMDQKGVLHFIHSDLKKDKFN